MSLNEGFWSIYHSPWSDGYSIGEVTDASLIRDIEVGREMRHLDPRVFDLAPRSAQRQLITRLAADRVQMRQLVELGCIDLGGEGA